MYKRITHMKQSCESWVTWKQIHYKGIKCADKWIMWKYPVWKLMNQVNESHEKNKLIMKKNHMWRLMNQVKETHMKTNES